MPEYAEIILRNQYIIEKQEEKLKSLI